MTDTNTQGASWEGKRTIIPKTRHFGKATVQNEELLKAVHAGEKYVIFHGLSGIVHIVPDAKLKEMFSKERAEGERRGMEKVDTELRKLFGGDYMGDGYRVGNVMHKMMNPTLPADSTESV